MIGETDMVHHLEEPSFPSELSLLQGVDRFPSTHGDMVERLRFIPRASEDAPAENEILPDGYFDLTFILSDSFCRAFIIGPFTKKKTVARNDYDIVKMRFRVGKIPARIDAKPSDLIDTMMELPKLFGLPSDFFLEKLLREKSGASKLRVMESLLSVMDLGEAHGGSLYRHATALIESQQGLLQVGELAQMMNISPRTLERRFMEDLGLSPKMFIRLIRFQKALALLRNKAPNRSLVAVAYELGYSDQAHFIRDFKKLSGCVPGIFNGDVTRFYNI